ncbi:MmgE/PrpD family protein [Alcaligenaceae bacterium]|nr:MmgE/PrpD family protein [Alcaligenaceae bacterium]
MTQCPPTDASRPFARYLLDTRLEDIPPAVIAATKRSLFDTVGVMLAGSGPHGGAHRVVRMLSMWGGLPSSTVIGHELRLPAPHAAFANGAMAHQFDFDDTHDQAVAHPTANTLAAGLAVAEALDGATGGDLLRAVVLGNDLTCRLGLAIEGSLYEYPWTRPPIIGIWGATAAASVLLGLDEDRIRSAFGLTLHQTANTLECLYSPNSEVRGLRDGFSARNGVTAACMAQAGIQADHTAFEGRFGLFHAYFRGEYRRAALLDELGSRFEGEHVSIKPWPSARETHATIQAVLELRDRHELDPASIRSVMLRVGKTNLEFCEPGDVRRAPPSRMDALSSLPYAVAVALRHGNVPLTAYVSERLGDPAVLDIARKVHWTEDDECSLDGTIEGGRVSVTLDDGRVLTHSVRHAIGHPDHPLDRSYLFDKFASCGQMAAAPPSQQAIQELWGVIDTLETRPLADLTGAIRALNAGHTMNLKAAP